MSIRKIHVKIINDPTIKYLSFKEYLDTIMAALLEFFPNDTINLSNNMLSYDLSKYGKSFNYSKIALDIVPFYNDYKQRVCKRGLSSTEALCVSCMNICKELERAFNLVCDMTDNVYNIGGIIFC